MAHQFGEHSGSATGGRRVVRRRRLHRHCCEAHAQVIALLRVSDAAGRILLAPLCGGSTGGAWRCRRESKRATAIWIARIELNPKENETTRSIWKYLMHVPPGRHPGHRRRPERTMAALRARRHIGRPIVRRASSSDIQVYERMRMRKFSLLLN